MDGASMGLWHAVQYYDVHKLKDDLSYEAWPTVINFNLKRQFFKFKIKLNFFKFITFLGVKTVWNCIHIIRLVVLSFMDWNFFNTIFIIIIFILRQLHKKAKTERECKYAIFNACL